MAMRVFVVVLGLALMGGCGGPSVKTVGVSGVITLDGNPLAGADVNFISEKFAGYGKTNSQGRFELVQGAVAGENRVTISKLDPSKVPGGGRLQFSEDPEKGMDRGQLEAMAAGSGATHEVSIGSTNGETIPPEFSDPEKSQLKFVVPDSGTTSADFKLTSP